MVRVTHASSVLDTPPGDLVLRVRGTARDGQVVRLQSAKCTVGAGPDCTLRLRAPGVGPLHCLVLRGRHGIVVRRWSADTRLNGRAFTDAELAPNDRLGIGPIELEVVETGVPSLRESETGTTPAAVAGTLASPPEHSELDALRTDLESRRGALEEDRRRLDADRDALAARETKQRQELETRSAELDAEWVNLQEQRRQCSVEDLERQRRVDERLQQLDALRTDLESRRGALEEDRRQLEADRDALTARETKQRQELETCSAELDAERQSLDEQRQAWEIERAELRRLGGETMRSGSVRVGEEPEETVPAAAPVSVLAQLLKESPPPSRQPSQPGELPSPERGSPTSDAPVTLADILQRMGTPLPSAGEEEDSSSPAPPATTPRHAAAARSATPRGSSPGDGDEGEESIDEYMRRLLARSRGGDAPSQSPAPATIPSEPKRMRQEMPREPVSAVSQPGKPSQMAPRAVAPEKPIHLSAMRDLANLSARTAVDRHSRGQILLTTRAKLLIAILGLAVGGALFWMWAASGGASLTLYAAVTSFLVAVLWGTQFATLRARLTTPTPPKTESD